MGIEYNYPLEQLDKLVVMVYQEGRTPLLPDALKQEVALRYQELQHMDDDEDEDEDYRTAVQQHEDAMRKIEEERRKSHSRNVIILELTEEEKRELHEGMSASYVRSDPNSEYNMSDDDMNADAERKAIYKSLRSIGKIYYHQEDYRNAINIIHRAIEYSLRNDYPWLTFEEACKEFKEGRIKYTFAQLPLLYIDYNTQITDPKVLAGIVSGEIHLIDKDQEPNRNQSMQIIQSSDRKNMRNMSRFTMLDTILRFPPFSNLVPQFTTGMSFHHHYNSDPVNRKSFLQWTGHNLVQVKRISMRCIISNIIPYRMLYHSLMSKMIRN